MNTDDPTAAPASRSGRHPLARRSSLLGGAGVVFAGSAAALITALAGSAAASATITVDANGDGTADATHCTDGTVGNCTIRDAAAAAVDGDTIVFDPTISTITLTNGQILMQAVNITGPGAASLSITTTAAPGSYNVFRITGSGDVVVSGLTVTKNRIAALNGGKFTLDGVTISGSSAGWGGGALYADNAGLLEITDSRFENNSCLYDGGAVNSYHGRETTISGSTFLGNHSDGSGGALYSGWTDDLTITDSVFSGNTADGRGGALATPNGSAYVTSIINTTIDSNHADLSGGGIAVLYDNVVNISNTTISNNTSAHGGGIDFAVSGIVATIDNSTIAGNDAAQGAGGIFLAGSSSLTMNQSTISANLARGTLANMGGGGIAIADNTSVMAMSGTIVSGNTSPITRFSDIALYQYSGGNGSFTASNSIIGELDSRITSSGTNIQNLSDPMLGALADNGGPTKTMAPLPGSPAIDAGPDPVATFTGNGFDQRGTPWLRVYNGTADIGAFEEQPDPTPTTTTTTTEPTTTTTTEPTTTTTSGTDPVVPAFTG